MRIIFMQEKENSKLNSIATRLTSMVGQFPLYDMVIMSDYNLAY